MHKLLAVALFLSLNVFALSANAAGAYSGPVTIESIRATSSGGLDVRTVEIVNGSCTNDGKFFRVANGYHNMTGEGVKAALSVALAAFTSGKKVVVYVDTGSVNCYASLVQIVE